MLPLQFLITPFTAFLSIFTATGVVVHDMNLDKAAIAVVAIPAVVVSLDLAAKLGADAHTHSEPSSLSQAVRDLRASQPRVQPRNEGEKKYAMPKATPKGHHPFDNYFLPIV